MYQSDEIWFQDRASCTYIKESTWIGVITQTSIYFLPNKISVLSPQNNVPCKMLELSLLLFLQRKGSPNQMAPNISVIKQARLHTSGHLSLIQTAGFTQNKTQNIPHLKGWQISSAWKLNQAFHNWINGKVKILPTEKKSSGLKFGAIMQWLPRHHSRESSVACGRVSGISEWELQLEAIFVGAWLGVV